MTRADKWDRFDEIRENRANASNPPAFIQTVGDGLWAVQHLVKPSHVAYGPFTRICNDPPSPDPSEPYYTGWPGDHRGWMRFASASDAREFYLFSTGRITMDEYTRMGLSKPKQPSFRYALDDAGDFVEHPQYDAPPLQEDYILKAINRNNHGGA